MKKLLSTLLLISILIVSACKKEYESDAQKIANKIQEVIKNENIARVIPTADFVPGSGTVIYDPAYGRSYTFNLPFILIGNTNYNLVNIKRYEISYIDSDKTLFLVF